MELLFKIDWNALLVPQHSPLEMIVRGTIMYVVLFALLRLIGRRQASALGTADLLVIVLLADAAQNGMANDYKSVTEGIVLVATILAWDYAIDWASFRFPVVRDWLRPPALPLITNGKLQRRNMRQELITTDELMSQLREAGVEDPAQVKRAFLEGDGRLSVIKISGSEEQGPKGKRMPAN